jgi:hypothetical protein
MYRSPSFRIACPYKGGVSVPLIGPMPSLYVERVSESLNGSASIWHQMGLVWLGVYRGVRLRGGAGRRCSQGGAVLRCRFLPQLPGLRTDTRVVRCPRSARLVISKMSLLRQDVVTLTNRYGHSYHSNCSYSATRGAVGDTEKVFFEPEV